MISYEALNSRNHVLKVLLNISLDLQEGKQSTAHVIIDEST